MTARTGQRLMCLLLLSAAVVVCAGQEDTCYDPFMWLWVITTVFIAAIFGLQIAGSRFLRRKSPDR